MNKRTLGKHKILATLLVLAILITGIFSLANASGKDLRSIMAQMKLREGRNFLAEDNGIKTYAQVKGGQVVGYSSTDASGHSLSGRLEKRVTKCQWCVTDSKGRTTCQPVQCPKDPLPPPPKSQY